MRECVLRTRAYALTASGNTTSAGLLFAVHPVHVEAVASLVGRADLLGTLFATLAFACYYRARFAQHTVRSFPRTPPAECASKICDARKRGTRANLLLLAAVCMRTQHSHAAWVLLYAVLALCAALSKEVAFTVLLITILCVPPAHP